MLFFRSFILIPVLAAALAAGAAELQLVFEERLGWSDPASGNVSLEAPKPLVVRLGADYFYDIREERLAITDLGRERSILVRKGIKVTDYPLAAEVLHRSRALMDAGKMVRLMQSLGTDGDSTHPLYELEARHGMRAGIPLARQPDVRRIPPDGTVYTFGGMVICEVRTGRREIPPAFRLVWERYLAYDWPVHPDIREAILLNAKVPSEIRFREKIGERTRYRNLTLSSLELVADSAYTAEIRDAPFAPSGIPVERIWNRLRGDGPAPRRLAPADFDQAFKTSVKNSLFSEALLVAIESNLQEGRDIGAAIQALAPGMDMDPILIQLIKGMDIADAAAAAKALDALEDVSANAFARGHIVHVLRADALRRQEKWKEAEAEYLLALEANPYLTAALVRLGNVYVETARIQQAYLAWELAAWIQARHPLLGDIRALDQAVRQEHPLFFLPAER